jgi:hypothetical protein
MPGIDWTQRFVAHISSVYGTLVPWAALQKIEGWHFQVPIE